MFPAAEEDAGPFRPEQPLVAIGRQEVDRCMADVQRKDAQSLDGVEEQQGPAAVDQFGQPVQIVPPSAGVGHPTDRDNAGSIVASGGELVEIDRPAQSGDSAGFHAAIGQVQPGILVRGELVGPSDDVITRPPRKPLGHEVDAGRGVAYQGDLLRHGADQLGGGGSQMLDATAPVGVVGGPVVGRVFGPLGQCLPGRPTERRHRSVIEIGPLPGDGHLAAEKFPIGRPACQRFPHNIRFHVHDSLEIVASQRRVNYTRTRT